MNQHAFVAQLEVAGFVDVAAHSLVPGESFYPFVSTHPGSAKPTISYPELKRISLSD